MRPTRYRVIGTAFLETVEVRGRPARRDRAGRTRASALPDVVELQERLGGEREPVHLLADAGLLHPLEQRERDALVEEVGLQVRVGLLGLRRVRGLDRL